MENINLKRKVTLKRKSDKDDQLPEDKKPNKVIPIIIISIILLMGVFWYINKQNNGSPEESPVVTETPVTPSDSLANQPEVASDTVSNEQPTGAGTTGQETSTNGGQEPTNIDSKNNGSGDTNVVNSGSEGSVEKKAQDVIDGAYGNGEDRKNALGAEYDAIQAKVNEMYRNKR